MRVPHDYGCPVSKEGSGDQDNGNQYSLAGAPSPPYSQSTGRASHLDVQSAVRPSTDYYPLNELSKGYEGSLINSALYSHNTANSVHRSTASSSSCSSHASSIPSHLPLCPQDDTCALINDKPHQRRFAHTCRLFPCYHGHIRRHAKLFRHVEGQIVEQHNENQKPSASALTSVTFSSISREAPNAYPIFVGRKGKRYEISGDWAAVKVHTFKRYLHQVYLIPPAEQSLVVASTGVVLDDELRDVKSYHVERDTLILLTDDEKFFSNLPVPFDDL